MKSFVALAFFLVGALLLVGQILAPNPPIAGQPAGLASAAPNQAAQGRFSGEEISIDRDSTGQFHVGAKVNGAETRMLVDTGADLLALTVDDAAKAGLDVNPNSFVPILKTASGEGYGTLVTLERFEIGDTELHNVGAVVVKDLGESLLGQTVLSRMGRVELKGDRMVIEQQP